VTGFGQIGRRRVTTMPTTEYCNFHSITLLVIYLGVNNVSLHTGNVK